MSYNLLTDINIGPRKKFRDWLWPSILLIFCLWPLGIVAIIYSIIAIRQLNRNDYAGATKSSIIAGRWVKAGVIIALLIYGILAMFFVMHPEEF